MSQGGSCMWRGTERWKTGRKGGGRCMGRREKREWEAGFPRWQEAGEKQKTLCNIVQYFAIFCNGLENALCLLSEIEDAFQSTF